MGEQSSHAAEEHFERGNALDQAGDRDGAVREWIEAIALDPELAAAHYNLGIAYADEGNLEHATQELNKVIRLDPFDMDARRELAEMLFEMGRVDEGINQLRQALNLVQNDGESAHLLAQAYVGRKEWDRAAGALDSGAMLVEDADLWFEIGKAYLAESQSNDAILAFRRALVCQPDHRESEEMLRRLHVPVEEPPELEEL